MNIGITTNISNGIGLAREFELLRDYLMELGHKVIGMQFDEEALETSEHLDLMISIETVCRHLLNLAPVNWLVPNPEWTKRTDIDIIRRSFSKILCKTREGERIFSQIYPDLTHYVGFLARDRFDPSIKREPIFLHVGGNSSFRGTQAVLDAWKWTKNGAGVGGELIILSKALQDRPEIPGVTYLDRIPDDELRVLQNRCKFHLYPSGTEGFGHAIREGMSVNASILVTNAPPMNEIKSAHTVPDCGKTNYNLADVYEVSAIDVHVAAKELLELDKLNFHQEETREEFLRGNEEFKHLFSKHLEECKPHPVNIGSPRHEGKMRISFIGNFEASESTENMILWALEQGLGHEVERIQENKATMRQLQIATSTSDLLLWVRTPGWLPIPDDIMADWLKTTLVKTASIHLDKFWGIPEREKLIGVHPFWKTDFVFTADGSRQEDFAKRGVNHLWMMPAVSEEYIHPGRVRDCYRCDVGFVGARDYHSEYPFRAKMISFLEQTYGNRFKHIQGVRGHELNDAYASIKIVVGDCIFAGIPNYWSDRVPETIGRHGFLLHPIVPGLPFTCGVYTAQNLEALHKAIEMMLPDDDMRKAVVAEGVRQVRTHHTWTVRMKQIIDAIGL